MGIGNKAPTTRTYKKGIKLTVTRHSGGDAVICVVLDIMKIKLLLFSREPDYEKLDMLIFP